MSLLITAPAWLYQSAALRDTIVTIQVPAGRSWTDIVIAGGQLVVSLAVLALLVAIVLMLVALRKGIKELTTLLHSSYGELSAAAHGIRNVADDVKGITGSLRGDVDELGATVRAVNDGVKVVLGRAKKRLRRLDALVDVAQAEAEEFVVNSAATLRGLRFGASALRRSLMFAGRGSAVKRRRRRRRFRAARDGADRRAAERPRIRTQAHDHT